MDVKSLPAGDPVKQSIVGGGALNSGQLSPSLRESRSDGDN